MRGRRSDDELTVNVETWVGCIADHPKSSLECSVDVEGSVIRVETRYQFGRDSKGSCGPTLVERRDVVVEPGTYTL